FPTFSPRLDNRAALLQGLLIGTIIIAALYVARDVLLPLTLAVLLSFVLTSPSFTEETESPSRFECGVGSYLRLSHNLCGWLDYIAASNAASCRAPTIPNHAFRKNRSIPKVCF